MDCYDLNILLEDSFRMDMYFDSGFSMFNKSKFEHTSYSLWALDELESYICKQIGGQKVSINEMIRLTKLFQRQMRRYWEKKQDPHSMFRAAIDILDDVLDLLRATR